MSRPPPFHRASQPPVEPLAPVRTLTNAWIKHVEDSMDVEDSMSEAAQTFDAVETFNALLDAIEEQETGTLEHALNRLGVVEHHLRGYLTWLGRLWVHESDSMTAEVLFKGLDLLRPDALALDDEDYRRDVLGLMHLLASENQNARQNASPPAKGPRLMAWLIDLVAERGTNLALTMDDVHDTSEGVSMDTLTSMALRLENVVLRSDLNHGPLAPAASRRRL